MTARFILTFFILPLFVALISGIILFFLPMLWSDEKSFTLSYERTNSVTYDGETLTIATYVVNNSDTTPLSNVEIVLGLPSPAIELEARVIAGRERTINFADQSDLRPVIKIGNFRGHESITVQVFARSLGPLSIAPELYSDEMEGFVESVSGVETDGKILRQIIPFTLTLALWLGLTWVISKRFRYIALPRTLKNNFAFSMLHLGHTDVARNIYSNLIATGEADVYVASNYAFCLILDGDLAGAVNYIKVADMLNGGEKHTNTILNTALIYWKSGRFSEAKSRLSKLGYFGRRRLAFYEKSSQYFKQMSEDLKSVKS